MRDLSQTPHSSTSLLICSSFSSSPPLPIWPGLLRHEAPDQRPEGGVYQLPSSPLKTLTNTQTKALSHQQN